MRTASAPFRAARWHSLLLPGSSNNRALNYALHFPNARDIDKPLANAAAEKIRESRAAHTSDHS